MTGGIDKNRLMLWHTRWPCSGRSQSRLSFLWLPFLDLVCVCVCVCVRARARSMRTLTSLRKACVCLCYTLSSYIIHSQESVGNTFICRPTWQILPRDTNFIKFSKCDNRFRPYKIKPKTVKQFGILFYS